MSSDPQKPDSSPDFIVTYGELTNPPIAPINQQNTAIDQVIPQLMQMFQPPQQNYLQNLLGQLAVSNPLFGLNLLGFNVNRNTPGVKELAQDASAGMRNAQGFQPGLYNLYSGGTPLFSNVGQYGPFGYGVDFSGANLLDFFPNITGQSPAAASSSSGPIRIPPRRRHRATRRLVRVEDVEPPTDMVPDDEWQRKVVEYCIQSQLYRTWKHGKIGMDCLINPNGPKMFPQTVYKAPNNSRNLFHVVAHDAGEQVGSIGDWNTMSEDQMTVYRTERSLLQAEVQFQIEKGWINPVKRFAKGNVGYLNESND